MVTLVRLMTFFSYGFPLVGINLGKEGIGLGRLIADMGEIQSVGHSYRLTIEGLTTDDKNLFVGGTTGQSGFKRREHFGTRERQWLTGKNHIATVRQCSLGERLKGLAWGS